MMPTGTHRELRGTISVLTSALSLCLLLLAPTFVFAQIGVELQNEIPGSFDPDKELRDPKPYRAFGADSLAQFNHEAILFRHETELDTARGYYVSTRKLFGREYGRPLVESREDYRSVRFERQRDKLLRDQFYKNIAQPGSGDGGGALTIQVPFRIKSKTFQKIFGGDRVGLQVSGRITVDGDLRREKSDQVIATRNDQSNTNFKIDQTQQFNIEGNVGEKVSVQIDQDSERVFDFNNNVRLTYEGYEDEIIQSIHAGNISLDLPGTRLATFSAKNEGLFGFKTVSKVGPLSITTIASLQKGEKNKLSYEGGSEAQVEQEADRNYRRNQYFFLDPAFRENYRRYTRAYNHVSLPNPVVNIQVYKSVQGRDRTDLLEGWAIFDTTGQYSDVGQVPNMAGVSKQGVIDMVNAFNADNDLQSAEWAEFAFFEELDPSDYEYEPNLGYIRLAYPAGPGEVIAVAYTLEGQPDVEYGTINPTGNHVILKLLKPENPLPTNPTWDLAWKHVYWVGTTNLKPDDFRFSIVRNTNEGNPELKEGANKSWLEVFNLDLQGEGGAGDPDGVIDERWVKAGYGEVEFPDLHPFDPIGYVVDGDSVFIDLTTQSDTLRNPEIYTSTPDDGSLPDKLFTLKSEYSNTSANINLGINVLEGSEEIFLNGAALTRDEDYIIDYLSGSITILNEAAFDPSANLEIKYESGEVFQLDQRTMLGIRLEYALWEDSFIGATLLNFNEKPIEKRVKVGNEPLQNFLWDINTQLIFRPYFMTQMVNAVPGLNTDEPSEVLFEGEIAQVFPNPNSLNNSSTGDNNGVAYVDDFEAAERSTPLGVRRKNWSPASHPVRLPSGDVRETPRNDQNDDVRGWLYWYNPYNQIPITDIWPNREVNSKVPNNTDVLTLKYDPQVNNLRERDVDPRDTWNGIMRALSPGFHNQTETKFLEVWMQWDPNAGGPDATVYFDLGQISEDVIPNARLDTEDNPVDTTTQSGNGILDDGEDTGLDRRFGNDPPWYAAINEPWTVQDQNYDRTTAAFDFWDLNANGVHDEGEPFSSDDWNFSGSGSSYEEINGTEDNQRDEARYPDTEDLDGNVNLNRANVFFRYQFKLNDLDHQTRYIRGGQDNPKRWRLIRIPLEDIYDEIGDPTLSRIEFFRIWMGDFRSQAQIRIAQIDLVGNEWLEDPVINAATGDTTLYISASTINTYDNPEDYRPPPGVAGEIDPITDIRSKEQSLAITIHDLPTAAEGQLIKTLYNEQDLREYRQLKMFVHGGGRNPGALVGKDLTFFLRFGSGVSGSNLGYYEYSLPLQPGWEGNEIVLSLDRLTRLKTKLNEQGGDFAYESLPNGHAIKVVGQPSIGNVSVYTVGVRNMGRPVQGDENLEVWVDELRLSGVRKEKGLAMRSSLDMSFADFMDINTNLEQEDSEFHSVDQRTGSDRSTIKASMNASMQLDKFLDPALGIRLPLRGSVASDLSIPKYTNNNGDVRTESLVEEGDLNIWRRFGEMALNRDHLENRYLLGPDGQPVIDENTNLPLQDPAKWGVDTLFNTGQDYSWSISYNKSRESAHWLPKYTVDNISASFNHSQRYSTSQNYQYDKSFTNKGDLDYSLSLEQQELELFKWTEGLWVLEDMLYDTRLNYLPSRVKVGATATQKRKSSQYRNAENRSSNTMSLGRDMGTSLRPFRSVTLDYDYTINSEYLREDSLRQYILYNDQSDSQRDLTFRPGIDDLTLISMLQDSLTTQARFAAGGPAIATEAEAMLNRGDSPPEVIDYIYSEVARVFPGQYLTMPWEHVGEGDPRYEERFWTVGGMPFANTGKNQNVRFNYRPDLLSWLTTSFDYSTRYNWTWQNYEYIRRSVSTNNNLGAQFSLRVRQLVPAEKGGGTAQDQRAKDFARMLGRDDFDKDKGTEESQHPEDDDEESEDSDDEQDEEARRAEMKARQEAILRAINPVKLTLGFLRKLQDIRVNYTQSTNYSSPGVEDGEPDLLYQLGFTGDSGLDRVEGVTQTSLSGRTDDYRISSGVDWSTRLSTTLDYNITLSKNNNNNRLTGSEGRSAFYLVDGDDIKPIDMPNYQVRWSGLEQFGPLKNVAQAITFNHAFQGEYREQWDMVWVTQDTLESGTIVPAHIEREVQSRNFKRNFSPLAGFNITWKHGISTNIRYERSESMDVQASNNTRSRNTRNNISLTASYTRKTGFRIPLPIWPFKNQRFNNETTFSFDFQRSETLKETQRDGGDWIPGNKNLNWSLSPSVRYSFSRNVSGSVAYKYGVTETTTNTTRFQEFGINVQINIRN